MILDKNGETFIYHGITYSIGHQVLATSQSEYKGLYGTIIEIRDGFDKETENNTPDIYCSFAPPTDRDSILKLEAIFSDLYQQPKIIDDISLDAVIMAPEMLQLIDE